MTSRDREQEQQATLRLIRAARTGDQEAFRQLVEQKRDQVFRIAYHHLGQVDAARAVAQSVFVRLWRKLDTYDDTRAFDTWLHRVTVNASVDHQRRARVRRVERPLDEARAMARPESDPVQQAELQRILVSLLDLLTDKQRWCFTLREVEGHSTAEVATIVGATESTVRNHIFQARRILREALAAHHPEYARGTGGDES